MQYIYTMNGVSKTVPPKRQILKDISLSFFPGAKIGVLGLNGSGKSTVLKIMASNFQGEARANRHQVYLEQGRISLNRAVREVVEEGVSKSSTRSNVG
jgi:ATPase subunit of ABC transporter with duplicated ATPase domains